MIRRTLVLLLSTTILLSVSCSRESGEEEAVAPPPSSGAKALTSFPSGENLLASGASVGVRPGELDASWNTERMIDGNPATGWASPEGSPSNQVAVLALVDKVSLKTVVIDTQNVDGEARGVRSFTLEMSDVGAGGPFRKIADITVEQPKVRQAFSLDNEVPGRWLRLTINGNHGDPSVVEIMEIEAYGEKLTDVLGQPSLVSFSQGATVIRRPPQKNREWSPLLMIDENTEAGWASTAGQTKDNSSVIALPEKTELSHLIFDTGSIDGTGRGAKTVTVDVSDQSAYGGFQEIATVDLVDRRDGQVFPVTATIPGRWVRLTIRDNHGDPDHAELMEFRAVGVQMTESPSQNVSGTYATEYGDMHLKQEGTFVAGCYEHDEGLIFGGLEGRVMKVSWRESDEDSGPAIMVFSPDGKRMNGLWWFEGKLADKPGFWLGDKISDEVGKCAHWSGDVGAEIVRDLEELGRARVYGINFDVDSDVIKDESKPTLDKIASVLKLRPSWKMTIEGHTDATGGLEYNLGLSERRAQSVVTYIASQGIEVSRLTAVGYGASQPVASNDSPLGQSQNRRVELKRD